MCKCIPNGEQDNTEDVNWGRVGIDKTERHGEVLESVGFALHSLTINVSSATYYLYVKLWIGLLNFL